MFRASRKFNNCVWIDIQTSRDSRHKIAEFLARYFKLPNRFNFLGNVLRSSPLVIYGERGVGKTSFLLTLADSLVKDYNAKVLLVLREKEQDLQKKKNIRTLYVPYNITINAYLDLVKNAINRILEERNNTNSPTAILIDDLLPKELLIVKASDPKLAFLPKVLMMGKIISGLTNTLFVVSTLENIKRGVPFKFRYYLKYGFNFLRIERVSRVRRLCLITPITKNRRIVSYSKQCVNAMLSRRTLSFIT